MADQLDYIGGELPLFAHAHNWKRYFAKALEPYIRGCVLEVGAGMGGTTAVLACAQCDTWVCLEPDPALAEMIPDALKELDGVVKMGKVVIGTIKDLPPSVMFDTIIYIDVLEHIEDDGAELARAGRRLNLGGRVIALSPAYMMLYSPFDAAIGHLRRYDRASLTALTRPPLVLEKLFYLDALGAFTSLLNRFILKKEMPTLKDITFWDKYIIPTSRLADKILFHSFGRSVVGVWKRPG